jgi:dihydrofolate synthase / folylpolyglutamate synthase
VNVLDYREALEWIHSRERFGIRPGLERVRYMLAELSNPHQQLKVIHIGGTNGKGSTAAFTASILREAGFKTGLYTSPYLESFTNRMAVDGQDVAEDVLVSLVEKVKPIVEECQIQVTWGRRRNLKW